MDAGTSAVLKSIKTLYQLFSDMKDGSPKVNDIRRVVGRLLFNPHPTVVIPPVNR